MLLNLLLQNKKQIFSKWLGEDIISLSDQTFIIPKTPFAYRVVEVTEDYIARPDLISKMLYGTDMYGDLLCKLNGISNPFELNVGDILMVPDVSDLGGFLYNAPREELDSTYEESVNGETKVPPVKRKQDKRKPNEAIMGETRFKIDNNRNVIIY